MRSLFLEKKLDHRCLTESIEEVLFKQFKCKKRSLTVYLNNLNAVTRTNKFISGRKRK